MNVLTKLGITGNVPRTRASAGWIDVAQAEKRASLYLDMPKTEGLSPLSGRDHFTIGGPSEGNGEQYHSELMLRHIYKRARANGWFSEFDGVEMKVALRTSSETEEEDATYLTAPHIEQDPDEEHFVSLLDLAGYLQCEVLVAVTSKVTSMLMRHLPPTVRSIPLDSFTNIQVVDTFDDFMSIRRAQFAAFVREYKTLLIWSDEVNTVLSLGRELEEKMVNLIWDEKCNLEQGFVSAVQDVDLEEAFTSEKKRSVSFVTPAVVAMALMATAVFIGQDLHEVVLQIKADGNYKSILIVLYFPVMVWLSSFFAQTFAVTVMQALGPVSQLTTNTKFYSGIPPARQIDIELPHITIQCPVYKEDLNTVLEPAVQTVRDAIKTYEMQGGTASIFMNDDGIQLLNPAERKRRIAFYKQNGIAWIGRPPDGIDGFVRAGKFKKASNMNYCMNLAYTLENRLSEVDRVGQQWSDSHEKVATETILKEILEKQEPIALGSGDVRIGDLILLIDADTRIPSDCLLDAAHEFNNCPDLAILQHTSLAFQVVNNYWEDCMAYFTLFVSEAMRFMVAGGDVCPFIGHNAFLRWSAVQALGVEGEDQRIRWWSEKHVSEDFEMSMKLQNLGYIVRMASYSGGAFKEGVSLTVYDEFNRWQKYAYGVSELIFHPLRYWLTKSPFTPLFREFLLSKHISGTSKYTMIAYMGSYYAIASFWLLALLNYFLVGWLQVTLTLLYQSSFQILIATLVLFDVAIPVINAVYRYRSRQSPLFYAIYENFKWILLLCIFFGGLSLHCTQSLLWHLLGIPLSWGSTAKSLESSYFLKEVPLIWKKYRMLYIIVGVISGGLSVLATNFIPQTWRIAPTVFTGLPIGWVLACHAAAPLLLNPQSWLSELHL